MCFSKKLSVLILFIFSCNAYSDTLDLADDETKIIEFDSEIESVFISRPQIADYEVLGSKKIAITGKSIGRTLITVTGLDGSDIYENNIEVSKDLFFIKNALKEKYPHYKIDIVNSDESVIIYGSVHSEKDKDDIYDLVGGLLNKASKTESYDANSQSSGDNPIEEVASKSILKKTSYKNVINKITISFPQQVNVQIKIAEVSTSAVNQLGVKWSGALSGNPGQFNIADGFSTSDITAFVHAINNNNVGEILAQPNVSVMSGESASILVGGEFPIVKQTSDTFNVEYKEFGVKLDLSAKVDSEEQIKISIATGISGIDSSLQVGDFPGFKKRSATSTLQIKNGGSFVLGGLINTEDRESLEKIPFIGDVPVLGALFRHTSSDRVKTELVVIATVNLVKEVSSKDIILPRIKRTSDASRWIGIDFDKKQNDNGTLKQLVSDGGFEL